MKESDSNTVHNAILPKLVPPAMVQETCFGDMFQSVSPVHGRHQPQTLPAMATSSYGYSLYPSAPQPHGGMYPTDHYGYPLQPGDSGALVGQQGGGGGGVGGTGGSPTAWATSGSYMSNISPRAASTGLVEDWGGVPASSSFLSSQTPMTMTTTGTPQYAGYRPPTGLSAFDTAGHMHALGNPLGQYPHTDPSTGIPTSQSHSPGMGSQHHHMGQPPSPSGHDGHGIQQSASSSGGSSGGGGGAVGPAGMRHVRQPYDWMKKQTYQSTPASGKTRTKDKYRIVYSEYQKVELEKEYLYSKYITIQRKAELSRSIGLSERQVKIWFQNRRAKERKQKRKREDVMAAQSTDIHSPEQDPSMKIEPSSHSIKAEMHHAESYAAHAQQQQQQHVTAH